MAMATILNETILIIIVLTFITCSRTDDTVQVQVQSDGDVTSQYPELPMKKQLEVMFENKSGYDCKLYWVSATGQHIEQAGMDFPSFTHINTFPGHTFLFALKSNPSHILYRTVMSPYIKVVTLLPKERMSQNDENAKHAFYKNYYLKSGQYWKNYYPRGPLTFAYPHHITHIGQSYTRHSNHTQHHKINAETETRFISGNSTFLAQLEAHKASTPCHDKLDISEVDHHEFEQKEHYILTHNHTEFYRMKTEHNNEYKLEVLCTAPVAIRIFDFLSDDECEHIISLAAHGMPRSTVGETKLTNLARTSSHKWIRRDYSSIVDNVVHRIGDMVDIDGNKLHSNLSSEDLQLVHYREGEYYREHFDYGTDSENNRYITVLLYLNDVEYGGNTSFRLASDECRDHNGYLGVRPIKRSALIFYDMLSDANVDDLSLHEAEPPLNGSEKWMTNLWIWDPYFLHQFGGYEE